MSDSVAEVEDLLAELVRIPSVNPREGAEAAETELARCVADRCRRAGARAHLDEVVDGRCNVVAEAPGRTDEWILLETHLDTVEADGMVTDPFEPIVEGDRLFGRGACDAKGSLAVFMTVLAAAARCPGRRGIRLVCAVDEEHRYRGVTHLLSGGENAVGAVVGEPTDLRLVLAHKGCVRGRVVAEGPGGHSSAPQEAINAIDVAADVIAYLRTEVAPALERTADPLVGAPTLAVTTIAGGSAPNVLPEHCAIGLDRRTVPGEDPEAVWAALRAELEQRWPKTVRLEEPDLCDVALPAPDGAPFAAELAESLDAAGLAGQGIGVGYGTDASKLAHAGVPAVVFGPGSIGDAHTARESVDLAQVRNAVAVLDRWLTGHESQ